MKKTIKSVTLKDLKPTVDLIKLMRKELGESDVFATELVRLTNAGILHNGGPADIPKVTDERMKKLVKEGKSIWQDQIDKLKDDISAEGYKPEEHSYMRVFRGNYLVDGCKRLFVLQQLFNDDYELDVEELTE